MAAQSPPDPRQGSADVSPARDKRAAVIAVLIAMSLALATFVASANLAATSDRQALAADTMERARDISRSVDTTLRTYRVALDTMVRIGALRVDFDLEAVAEDARLVGEQFGGWFTVTTGGAITEILLDSSLPGGLPPRPIGRVTPPEVQRAEAASLRLGRSTVSDAYESGTAGTWIVTMTHPIDVDRAPEAFLHFSVILDDITRSLTRAPLAQGDIAVIIDGSQRIIASSTHPDALSQSGLQEWAHTLAFHGTGVTRIDQPGREDRPSFVAVQRLSVAQNWTLAVARPIPTVLDSAGTAAWPGLLALSVLIITASIANLVMDRHRTKAEMLRTAREAAEREDLLRQVQASDARKARLMAVLAHDLRTPLVAILGSLDVYSAAQGKISRARVIDRMQRDGHGMLQLIDDVLELARLGAGEVRLRPEVFAPGVLLEDVAAMIRPRARQRNTMVTTDIGTVPPLLLGDLSALRRVLLNFATNAVKATQNGDIRLSVASSIAPGTAQPEIEFSVTDTGHGIAAEDIPKLFRDFGMLERDDDTREGTGLGLAICRRLAHAMGGEVGAESTPGKGSRFWLRLPLPEAVPDDTKPCCALPEDDPMRALAGLRILVADDHETIRLLTCNSLARCGAHPTEAIDGLDAVALAETQAFDLILMDQNMPHLDGTAAAARIRQGNGPSARARIVCISAHQTTAIAAMLSDLSLDGFLTKPIDLSKLGAIMQGRASPPAQAAPAADFDPDILAQLRDIDDGALLTRTLTRFADEITEVERDLAALVEAGDRTAARRMAHKLAGFCDLLGARSLSRSLRDFEDRIETVDPDIGATLFDDLVKEFAHTRRAVLDLTDHA